MGIPEYEIGIESSAGTVFKNLIAYQNDETITILTATLYYGTTPAAGDFTYEWYKLDKPDEILGTDRELRITKRMFDDDDITQFACKITRGQGEE